MLGENTTQTRACGKVNNMIIQFSFKNYKSFKDEALLDMTATSMREHSYNLIELENNVKLLKVAAIYGANASGKSNVIDAYGFMRFFALNSLTSNIDENKSKKKNHINVRNFAFNEVSKSKPTEFEVFFIYKNIEYQYGYKLDKEKIHEEWLYMRTKKGKKYDQLFERINNSVSVGKKLISAEKFVDSVDDKTLFLSLTAKTKIKHSANVSSWFFNNYIVDFGDINFEKYFSNLIPFEAYNCDKYKSKLENFLASIDSGISGIRIEKVNNSKNEDNENFNLFSKHINEKGEVVEIPFDEESSGTLKMFCLYDFFYDAMINGYAVFIDELNAKLHPLLVKYIINMFHDPAINANNSQLIFTTHDAFTLTKEIFRRDEIWFTEKDHLGASTLYSLAEFKIDDKTKVRNDAIYSKEYLSGRYGAIPILKDFNILEE